MNNDLLPCPFCSGEAVLRIFDNNTCNITCRECDIGTKFYVGDSIGASEAIAAWNTRAERTCEYYEVGSEQFPGETYKDTACKCSNCGCVELWKPNFCPDCGAKVIE